MRHITAHHLATDEQKATARAVILEVLESVNNAAEKHSEKAKQAKTSSEQIALLHRQNAALEIALELEKLDNQIINL